MKRLALLAFACCVLSAPQASAWDGSGHMEVAAVAWKAMTPAARARAGALLTHNPLFDSFTAGAAAGDRDRVAFIRAATWPDIIKGDHTYISDGSDNGNRPPPVPEASQNVGYSDKFMHKYWHFIDEPFSSDHTRTVDPVPPNAQTRIKEFRSTLPSNSSANDDVRSYDLVWLLHLVGDVHQPLHATSRFTAHHTSGDNGGNDVKIHCSSTCSGRTLHSFWDDLLGPNEPSIAEIDSAVAGLPAPSRRAASVADESVWINESFKLAQDVVYKSLPNDDADQTVTLSDAYKSKAEKIARQRVALAGARLANLLNATLK